MGPRVGHRVGNVWAAHNDLDWVSDGPDLWNLQLTWGLANLVFVELYKQVASDLTLEGPDT